MPIRSFGLNIIRKRLVRRLRYNRDALSIINKVTTADGQDPGPTYKNAINAFVVGCKADGIWSTMNTGVWRLMAGPGTLAGALVNGNGPDPTNVGFVAGDYDRFTGLKGDGVSKYLVTTNNNLEAQNDAHRSVYITELSTSIGTLLGLVNNPGLSGNTIIWAQANLNQHLVRNQSEGGSLNNFIISPASLGFVGIDRSVSATYDVRASQTNLIETKTSLPPANEAMALFKGGSFYTNGRLAYFGKFPSIGVTGMAALEARVTEYINNLKIFDGLNFSNLPHLPLSLWPKVAAAANATALELDDGTQPQDILDDLAASGAWYNWDSTFTDVNATIEATDGESVVSMKDYIKGNILLKPDTYDSPVKDTLLQELSFSSNARLERSPSGLINGNSSRLDIYQGRLSVTNLTTALLFYYGVGSNLNGWLLRAISTGNLRGDIFSQTVTSTYDLTSDNDLLVSMQYNRPTLEWKINVNDTVDTRILNNINTQANLLRLSGADNESLKFKNVIFNCPLTSENRMRAFLRHYDPFFDFYANDLGPFVTPPPTQLYTGN